MSNTSTDQQQHQATTTIQVIEDENRIVYVLSTETYAHHGQLNGEIVNIQAEGVQGGVNFSVKNSDTSFCP